MVQWWGRAIGRFGAWSVGTAREVIWLGDEFPSQPCIWVSWHRYNLVCLEFHRRSGRAGYAAFAPPGVTGSVVTAWLTEVGCADVVPLPSDGTGTVSGALKRMARNLNSGLDAVVALDGPRGPSRHARPGALWLARLTGAPIVPVAVEVRPSLSVPRWDRLLVPLPGSRIAVATGAVRHIARGQPVGPQETSALGDEVSRTGIRARRALAQS